MRTLLITASAVLLVSCQPPGGDRNQSAKVDPQPAAVAESETDPLALPQEDIVNPPAPGEPGGLPDDRTPISEAPFTAESTQGAANVVQTFFALQGARKSEEARLLWSDDMGNGPLSRAAFDAQFRRYSQYRGNVGAPGQIEDSGGSFTVRVPVQVYGRTNDGKEFSYLGEAKLRRPKAAEGQGWRIVEIAAK